MYKVLKGHKGDMWFVTRDTGDNRYLIVRILYSEAKAIAKAKKLRDAKRLRYDTEVEESR